MLAVLLGCGLRRSEVAALTLKHIQQRDNRWCIVDLIGKHGRVRTIPMPTWVKVAIDAWTAAVGLTEGHVLRPVGRGDQLQGERMTEKVVWQLLQPYAMAAGVPGIAPHDLRRYAACGITVAPAPSCAAPPVASLSKIQLLLGHASVQTTERYLGTKQDLVHAPNDGIKPRVAVWQKSSGENRRRSATISGWIGRKIRPLLPNNKMRWHCFVSRVLARRRQRSGSIGNRSPRLYSSI
jgi:integrase